MTYLLAIFTVRDECSLPLDDTDSITLSPYLSEPNPLRLLLDLMTAHPCHHGPGCGGSLVWVGCCQAETGISEKVALMNVCTSRDPSTAGPNGFPRNGLTLPVRPSVAYGRNGVGCLTREGRVVVHGMAGQLVAEGTGSVVVYHAVSWMVISSVSCAMTWGGAGGCAGLPHLQLPGSGHPAHGHRSRLLGATTRTQGEP